MISSKKKDHIGSEGCSSNEDNKLGTQGNVVNAISNGTQVSDSKFVPISNTCLFPVVRAKKVNLVGNEEKEVEVLLDNGSEKSFLTTKAARQLNLQTVAP